jgi:hypothetical protein
MLVGLGLLSITTVAAAVAAGCHHAEPAKTPPPPPPAVATCEQVSTHVRELVEPNHPGQPDLITGIMKVTLDRCTGDNWNDAARSCIMQTHDLEAGHHCLDHLPEAQRTAFMAAMHADATTPIATDDSGLPAECLEYKKAMDRYFDCDKIPKAARDAAKSAFDAAWESWKTMPQEAKESLGAACKAASDASLAMSCPT